MPYSFSRMAGALGRSAERLISKCGNLVCILSLVWSGDFAKCLLAAERAINLLF